ncbi:AraC family transcriptional regulator [Paenibacillus sp. VCA1]|uniref:AraC family transcriptional regulator n=1 Tax=Paenibacillus sp. VCA1 TaxID=3039148 RepID=UPI002872A83B|nr:AraC family transcriptional regulator [Paenibacillus sp. VCA1]MDR9856819.1 AraC family transcriptional regulator [Paenibacillus sp. VCA1]
MQIKNFKIGKDLKELTEHRTVVLPVACYETTINQNIHGYIPLHWHDEIQFVRMVEGEACFQINEEKLIVRQGDGLFINSGCLHMAEEMNESGCVYICLNVSPDFVVSQEQYATYVAPYIQATNLPYLYIDSNKSWGKNILDAIGNIHQWIQQKPPYFELDVTLNLTLVWKNLITNGFQLEYDRMEAVKSRRMKQMLSWIDLHYAEKITLDDIARAGQLSRSECCRYFKRMLKMTPLNYVIDYRIQKSLVWLQRTESNVTEVGYKVGFNSTSYFIERFKKAKKMTPLAYKKLKMDNGSIQTNDG